MELINASFQQISSAVKAKKLSAKEVTQFFLDRVSRLDRQLNSFITINDQALLQAESIDQKIAKGENGGKLAGVPFGIKDMFCTKGLRTTAASKILGQFKPPYDATVVKKLKDQGVVVLGKLNQDEFAMGSSNETSAFGVCRNPWNTQYVSGGSSGGSAAAQASRLVAGTIGTDTGGSIRQPASFCGIVGLKPTYGRISRYGIVAYASSLDQAGPMVSSVEDAALALEVMAGRDERDSTTANVNVPEYSSQLNENIKGMKVGVIKEYMESQGVNPDTLKVTHLAIENLKKLGAEIVEVSIPLTPYAVPVYYLVAASEASSNLSRYDGVKYGYRYEFPTLSGLDLERFYMKTRGEGFGTEVKRRIMLGTYCLSAGYYDAYYKKASQVRRMIRDQFNTCFLHCDVILTPVTTSPAFKIGEKISDPLAMYLNDIYTVSTNLAGLPGMSVPYGLSTEQLPIGVQLMARHFEEQKMLNVAFALEKSSTVKGKVPHVI